MAFPNTLKIGLFALVFLAAGSAVSIHAQEGVTDNNYTLLENEIRSIMAEAPSSATWGVCVREVDSPMVIALENDHKCFIPGATQMLLTTAAALDWLGPNFRYLTTLSYTGIPVKGTLTGNLYVRGEGDPTIGGRMSEDPDRPEAIFRKWAKELKRCGIENIVGHLVVDDLFFNPSDFGQQWPPEELGAWYTAEVSALTFNENCIGFICKGGRKAGKRAECLMVPPTEYMLYNNSLQTGGKDLAQGYVHPLRQSDSRLIDIKGIVPAKSEMRVRAAVPDPTLYFATVFRETLLKEGVAIGNETVKLRDIPGRDAVTSGTYPVVVNTSPPLADIVDAMNHGAQCLYADTILVTLGKRIAGEGTREAGARVVTEFLDSLRIPKTQFAIDDGSGASLGNSISPWAMTELLEAMTRHSVADAFEKSLESAGKGSFIGRRLEKVLETDPDAPLRIRAVSGHHATTRAQAGYATSAGGVRLVYTFFVSTPSLSIEAAESLLDRMALALARSPLRAGSE